MNEGKEKKSGGGEIKRAVWGILFATFFVLSLLSFFGGAGIFGKTFSDTTEKLFGFGFFMIPLFLLFLSVYFFRSIRKPVEKTQIIGLVILIISFWGLLDVLRHIERTGGIIGFMISWPFFKIFGFGGALTIFIALILISLVISLKVSLNKLFAMFQGGGEAEIENNEVRMINKVGSAALEDKPSVEEASIIRGIKERIGQIVKKSQAPSTKFQTNINDQNSERAITSTAAVEYTSPPLDFLDKDKGYPSPGDIKANSQVIKRTLANFGIEVEMGEINVGPAVTQYTLRPAVGIKLSRITGLHNDLALALAAHPLRIEAPIPGKSLVGVEIPNKSRMVVRVRDLIDSEEFKNSSSLTFPVGRDVAGQGILGDLSRMPHLLIAGSTGSGKSIAINNIIISLLYKNSPQQLKFILIDPKRVELTLYNGIPHLLTSVIEDPKEAIVSLKWATKEMERRYEILSKHGTRDITGFNERVAGRDSSKTMPYIVLMVDELADLMNTYGREIEGLIVRLAQMARATGIHIVLSTQRPSVDVLTGLIKANITARIAFQVASQVDSRTILDMSGAEKLLSQGDMLYVAGDGSKPKRIQGVYISENEAKKIVGFLKRQEGVLAPHSFHGYELNMGAVPASLESGLMASDEDFNDDLYEEAKKLVLERGIASSSYLQRRLKVGYARAARLIDMMEKEGIVGSSIEGRPREVIKR